MGITLWVISLFFSALTDGAIDSHVAEDDYLIIDDHVCTQYTIAGRRVTDVLTQCFDLGNAHWYGGPEQRYQFWPIETGYFAEYSYVTKAQENQGIAEPYWLSSTGTYVYVAEGVPLFIDLNNMRNNSLCLIAKSEPPYSQSVVPVLKCTVCTLSNPREAHEHAIANFLGKPSGIPDERMIRHPIWSTWARYKANVDENIVLQFADEILDFGFNNSQLEIDDNWEECYGSLTWNKKKFPNISNLTTVLKDKGFRVTLWVHPFVNLNCNPWHAEGVRESYFVMNTDGNVNTTWWNGAGSNIDFTNPAAVEWYVRRLQAMLANSGVDSLKFDAGETSWLPQLPVLNVTSSKYPDGFTTAYVNDVSQFGPMIEVRVARRSQNLPIFVRMLDKDSNWGWNNGLKTLVTTLLMMNIAGYPFVLPDMIGGNGYGTHPTKELFIRWLQANVFMPSLQFSYVPWDYDEETVSISKKLTALHVQYADTIIELARRSVQDGSPINPPIWWIDPTDETALGIWDEFLLGENILVAPVLEEGARSRDIYLPAGKWLYQGRGVPKQGNTWLRNCSVPLDEVPYFVRVQNGAIDSHVAEDNYEIINLIIDGKCHHYTITKRRETDVLKRCFNLGNAHWYGGPEQRYQFWPIETGYFAEYSYVTKAQENQGIAEPYWLSSTGQYIYVAEGVPLFIDLNNMRNNSLCLIAKNEPPYLQSVLPVLKYTHCFYSNPREAHEHAIAKVLGKPCGIPDERMIRHPIWSTWARYKANVDENIVLQFANEILDFGFNNSQLEIDDNWEECYGSLTWNKKKFPNISNLTTVLKDKGFRVTLWVHPFVNLNCNPWHAEGVRESYFVMNTDGNVNTTWWNGAGSNIDFTNPAAVEWYVRRLQAMLANSGVDSLKFDAGETSWLPQLPVLNLTSSKYPDGFTTAYVNDVSQFGPMIEVRVARRSQNLPIFVRMLDKDSNWGWNNGLKTLVTTLLMMNIAGYPFVLPDMIGGNGYGAHPTKELFIRWLQANVFMPSLQFSYVPWDYDEETVSISKKLTALHVQYADTIIELARRSVQDGSPINPPIWWIDPTDETALGIWDEFLLGENILVAPVLEEGARGRDIYLPAGEWLYQGQGEPKHGNTWLRSFSVPLDEVPYFVRIQSESSRI